MKKQFAARIPRTEEGWIRFPPDYPIRREIWDELVPGTNKLVVSYHPAKYNIHMVWAIAEYISNPGDLILDPMSGTGTTMLAATLGREVVLIEVEEGYHQMQQDALANLNLMYPDIDSKVMLLRGDCRKLLPMPADAIIFSPPYADMLRVKGVSGIAAEEDSSMYLLAQYSSSPWNIGNYNYFMYFNIMQKVYKALAESAPIMAVVVKDRYREMKRVPFVADTVKCCEKVGWKLVENIIIQPPSSEFVKIKMAQGYEMVEDESILILRRK